MGVPYRSRKPLASLLLAALAIGVTACLWFIAFHGPVYGTGVVLSREPIFGWPRVIAASPAARRAGITPGTDVNLRSLSLADRVRWRWGAPQGHQFTVRVRTDGQIKTVRLRATEPIPSSGMGIPQWITLLTQTLAVLLVGYLAFLRPSLMTFALLVYECGTINIVSFGRTITGLPDWAFAPLAVSFVTFFGDFPNAALASFAARFPHDRVTGWRLRFARVVDALVVLALFAGLAAVLLGVGVNIAPFFLSAYAALVLTVSIVSLVNADPKTRGRIAVVFVGTMCSSVAYSALVVVWIVNGQHSTPALAWAGAFAPAILPIAVSYGILRHRVFDIGFVVNRALVYAVTSAVLVVFIEALEQVAERFVRSQSHVANTITEFVITLIVVLCIRFVHRRVDRAVDNVFFRARHEQERSLLRFATTAQFFTNASPLIRDGVEAVEKFGRVHGAAIYLPVGGGASCSFTTFPANASFVDENDVAFVELRAHGGVLDTHGRRTAFPGVRLYPMMLAGRLVGVIAAGERESGEEMPPDIDDAIRAVAASIGMTLEAIETARLRAENAALRRGLGHRASVKGLT